MYSESLRSTQNYELTRDGEVWYIETEVEKRELMHLYCQRYRLEGMFASVPRYEGAQESAFQLPIKNRLVALDGCR